MPRYQSLLTFTQQGLANVEKSPQRANKFRKAVEAAGGQIISQYWSIGEFDGGIIFDAPSEQSAATLLLELAKDGNVRTRTMRIFDETEFQQIAAG
jgi:uncharacterized protein with GYD domain